MDKATLVSTGKAVVDGLRAENIRLKAAAWLLQNDRGWRLYLAPDRKYAVSRDYYEQISKVVRKRHLPIDLSIIEAIESDGILTQELIAAAPKVRGMFKTWDNLRLGPYFVEEAILFGL